VRLQEGHTELLFRMSLTKIQLRENANWQILHFLKFIKYTIIGLLVEFKRFVVGVKKSEKYQHLPPHKQRNFRAANPAIKGAYRAPNPVEVARLRVIRSRYIVEVHKFARNYGRILFTQEVSEPEYEHQSHMSKTHFLCRKKTEEIIICKNSECQLEIPIPCVFFIRLVQESKLDSKLFIADIKCRDCFEDELVAVKNWTRGYIYSNKKWKHDMADMYLKVLSENQCFKDGPCNAIHLTRSLFKSCQIPEC
jgi:hypothetical protein